jgi:fumarate reductase subunit D
MSDNPLQSVTPAGETSGQDVVRDQDKIMLVLAYLGILALIPLLTVKDSEYVKWHAKQGLALGIVAFVAMLVLGFIPVINLVAGCVLPLGYIALVVVAIIQAFKPNRWKIPGVTLLAEKF